GLLEGARLERGTFTFVGPNFDPKRPKQTGITSEQLYADLSQLPCRKLVLLNACHSGDVQTNLVRDLSPDGVGPIIYCDSEHKEFAFADEFLGGLFTKALVEALDDEFTAADRDKNNQIDTLELAMYVRARVPQLLKELKREYKDKVKPGELLRQQTPTFFP